MAERYPVEHRPHGHVAYWYLRRPRRGELVDPRLVVLVDGRTPVAGSLVRCGSCDELLGTPDIDEAGEGGGALYARSAT